MPRERRKQGGREDERQDAGAFVCFPGYCSYGLSDFSVFVECIDRFFSPSSAPLFFGCRCDVCVWPS